MKSKLFMILFIVISGIAILLPFLLDALIKNELLTFSPGAVDAWISFWGSYVGAIIGASVVYFVARIQIQKQDEQQMIEMELRGTYDIQREMKFFYMTTKMEKIEEFINNTDELSDVIRGLFSNMFRVAIALSGNLDVDEEEKKNFIEEMKLQGKEYIENSNKITGNIDYLAYYIPELNEDRVKILQLMEGLIDEWHAIEVNYENYLVDKESTAEGLTLFGIAKEASDETSRISQELKVTLSDMQVLLLEQAKL